MNRLQYFDQIEDVLHRSGQLIMQKFYGSYQIFEKNDNTSLYTTVDLENEEFLMQELAKIIPQAGFLTEESGIHNQSDWMWILDPLDGTKNFIKGIPLFCIMVVLMYKNNPQVAAIYQPATKELYYAEQEKGVWFNKKPMLFSNRLKKQKTALVICSDHDLWKKIQAQTKKVKIQVSRRHFGSAGIDTVYLLQGCVDLIVYTAINFWDIAPILLFAQELQGLQLEYKQHQSNNLWYVKVGNNLFFDKNL
ncbi:MAG: inositol monophosphatase family protein [Candidatus Chromulinivorax sp.]